MPSGAQSRAVAMALPIGSPSWSSQARWLSLMSTASKRPIRWFSPPPQRTAYFSSNRQPGSVFRVSRIDAFVPATAATYRAVRVATPLRCWRKFRAVRSKASSVRIRPATSAITSPGTTDVPSSTSGFQPLSSSISNASRPATGRPATTPGLRATIRPEPRAWAGMRMSAVRSPKSPRSSASPRAISSSAAPNSEGVSEDMGLTGLHLGLGATPGLPAAGLGLGPGARGLGRRRRRRGGPT